MPSNGIHQGWVRPAADCVGVHTRRQKCLRHGRVTRVRHGKWIWDVAGILGLMSLAVGGQYVVIRSRDERGATITPRFTFAPCAIKRRMDLRSLLAAATVGSRISGSLT